MRKRPALADVSPAAAALTICIAFLFVLGLFKHANATQADAFSWANFYGALPMNALIVGGFLVVVYLGSREK